MKNEKLFDCRNASSIFSKIMKKYYNRNNNVFLNNKGYIAYAIEQKREKLQFEEKDNMYIYKEAKNIANSNELLLELYGNKAKKRFYDISKLLTPIKLDRKLFFSPNKKEEKNNRNKDNLDDNFINKKGFMKLPIIDKDYLYNKIKGSKSIKKFLTTENMKNVDRKRIIKNLENKKQKKLEKEELGIDALKLKIKNKSHKNISLNYKKNLPASSNKISKSSKSNKNILSTQKLKNESIKEYKSKEKIMNKDKNNIKTLKTELTLSDNYILKLTDFRDQLIKEEEKNRKYFNKNDYGCRSFKEKYNYINSKYFN